MTTAARKWRQMLLLAAVEVMGLTVWFSATAVSPSLQDEWSIDSLGAVWFTASVQLGFVAGGVTSALLTLGDRFPPHFVIGSAAFGAGLSTVMLAIAADGLWPAIVLRFLTGMFLAGVYPIGMKVMSTWASPRQRGIAFGLLLGALTVGSGLPHLISGLGDRLPWRMIMVIAACIAIVAGFIAVMWIRPGEHGGGTTARPKIRYAWEGFRTRAPLLANLGYFGHMWELYALWTWLPTYLLFSQKNMGEATNSGQIGLWAFIAIGAAGLAGCLIGGWIADRFGRSAAAVSALVVSGMCCLLSPVMFSVAEPLLLVFLIVWGASVIADSGVFSTALSESVDPNYVGTSLTAQTTIGYLITVITIQLVPLTANLSSWQFAFLILLPGPIVGAIAMHMRRREQPDSRTEDEPVGEIVGTTRRSIKQNE
ncbi:MFS transporter [Brevibacterium marinum]|uniref:MFS family permease n=1 Tax=Brevibacterium marinum TaxID=418643 RepID=A0A846S061_9MICO|nr:MFS family permease [Brevibacterium marinum]